MTGRYLRLGVNIDHVATIRNARGGAHPDPLRAARVAENAGADGITAHLREDRRHICDDDIRRLSDEIKLPLNLEMAATPEMLDFALRYCPHAACIVPEKREERTTEGGLDLADGARMLEPAIRQMCDAGIRVSLFIEPNPVHLDIAKALGAPVVELHTGAYCLTAPGSADRETHRQRIVEAASHADNIGLECHAGHGLDFETVGSIAAIASVAELNIGHFLIGEAIFGGLESAIKRMRALMDEARADVVGERSA